MTFHGKPRAPKHVMDHVHESPRVMIWPLYVLAAGAVFAGFLLDGLLVGEGRGMFWGKAIYVITTHDPLGQAEEVPEIIKLMPTIMCVFGIALAYVMYIVRPEWPDLVARRFRGLYLFLLNKWYFDELYDFLFVKPAFVIGRGLWKGGDGAVIDGLGPDGFAAVTRDIARRASRLQSGYVYHYAFAMLIGVVVLVSFYLYRQVR
jgi:NADH-quinone oxidoreductase subunit L